MTAPPPRPEAAPGTQSTPPIFLLVIAAMVMPVMLAYALATNNELRVVAGFIGLLGALTIVWRPFWGLIFLVGLIYIRVEEAVPELAGMRLTLIVSLATLVGTMLQMMLSKERLARTPLVGMLAGFVLVVCLSTLNWGNTSEAMEEMAKLALLVLLVLNLVRTPERYQAVVTALLIFTGYLALFAVYGCFTGAAMQYQGLERSRGTGIFGDPNDLSAAIVFGLGLTLGRIPKASNKARAFYICLAAVMVATILMTHSRGAMLALVAVVFGFCLLFLQRKTLAIGLAVLGCAVLFVAAPGRMTNFDSAETSANERFLFWEVGFNQVRAYPLTGVGFRRFTEVNRRHKTAHNSFVLCFAELGLPGYFFFLGCLYYAFRRRPQDEALEPPDVPKPRQAPQAPKALKLPDAVMTDMMGARLGLIGFLVAVFWLSRTAVQITWLFIALAVAAQLAAGTGVVQLKGKERFNDWARILGLCFGSILFIKLMADYYTR